METASLMTVSPLYAFDREIAAATGPLIVGIDEAGRGPLAGPVVAAAVAIDLEREIAGVNDSKKLSAKKREALYERIVSEARFWAVGEASVDEIERLNILQATFLAMQRALDQCPSAVSLALVDGNQRLPSLDAARQRTVVDGDALSASIAAASIVAKVTRDRIMLRLHERFPQYDFAGNKGYGTAAHCRSIGLYGLTETHRRSFCERFVTPVAVSQ